MPLAKLSLNNHKWKITRLIQIKLKIFFTSEHLCYGTLFSLFFNELVLNYYAFTASLSKSDFDYFGMNCAI